MTMRVRTAEKFCNDGDHEVPVVATGFRDHKRVQLDLACNHSAEVRHHDQPAPQKVYCSECHDDCRVCDEDFPQIDAFTEAYNDLGGG